MKKRYSIVMLGFIIIAFVLNLNGCGGTKSEANPEASAPKNETIASDSEIEKMDISQLKNIANFGSENKKSPLALYYIAFNQLKSENIDEAKSSLKQLIDKYPGNYLSPKAHIMLCDIYSKNGDISSEVETLNKIASKYFYSPEIVQCYYRLAKIHNKNKKIDHYYAALDSIEVLAQKAEDKIPALFMNASERLSNLDSEKAIEKFDKLLAFNETTVNQKAQAMFGKAAAYENLAQADKAGALYDAVIKMNGIDDKNVESAKLYKQHLSKAPKQPIRKTKDSTSEVESNGRIK